MDAMNVKNLSRKEMVKLMREMRDTARQQLTDAITETPMTAQQLSAISGQTYYTDVGFGVYTGVQDNGGCVNHYYAEQCSGTKFLREVKNKKRKFVEVDDDGNVIKNGKVIKRNDFVNYYYLNPYFKDNY